MKFFEAKIIYQFIKKKFDFLVEFIKEKLKIKTTKRFSN